MTNRIDRLIAEILSTRTAVQNNLKDDTRTADADLYALLGMEKAFEILVGESVNQYLGVQKNA